ncbi:MAG: ComF family protein [Pseudolactococcus laudensis]
MTNCLLCHNKLTPYFQFSDIFLSRKPRETVCTDCWGKFEVISDRHCQICYQPDIDGTCYDCQQVTEPIRHRAIFHYNDFAKTYFQTYKFQGDFRLRSDFNSVLRNSLKKQLIVPVPVSPKRLQSRGFNQVTGFLSSAKLPYLELLTKNETSHQSLKTRTERLTSDNPFILKEKGTLPDKLLIIDDIYTTGATLRNAASTLKNAGCTHVSTFSLFR